MGYMDEPTWTHHRPKCMFALGFTLGFAHCMDFDGGRMTYAYIYHYSIIQNSLSALNILCAPLFSIPGDH